MAKARLLFRSKILYPEGTVREMIIWQLPRAARERKHELKYRLYYGDENGKCLVRYDNETGKGDHRHFADFQRDIDKWRTQK